MFTKVKEVNNNFLCKHLTYFLNLLSTFKNAQLTYFKFFKKFNSLQVCLCKWNKLLLNYLFSMNDIRLIIHISIIVLLLVELLLWFPIGFREVCANSFSWTNAAFREEPLRAC
jgi:hypothetical protein